MLTLVIIDYDTTFENVWFVEKHVAISFCLHEVTTNKSDVDEHVKLLMRNWHKIDMESYMSRNEQCLVVTQISQWENLKHVGSADNEGNHVKKTLFLLLF